MAKKKAGTKSRPKSNINKSQEIRNYLKKNPGAPPSEIKRALHAQGIEVSPGLISVVKYGGKNAKKKKAAAKRKGGKASGGTTTLTVEQLLRLKEFVDELGGIDQVRAALTALKRLQ